MKSLRYLLLFAPLAVAASPGAFHPPIVLDASDPGAAPSPYEKMLDATALSGGQGSELDLASLSHTITTFTLTADVSAITAVNAGNVAAVARQVAADPRWRLVQSDGAIIAFRRNKDGNEWEAPVRGYHEEDPTGVWRGALRFTPWVATEPWVTSRLVSHAAASAPNIDATAFTFPPHPGWQATALSWAGSNVALEVFEAGQGEDLPHTVEMLGMLPNYLGGVARESATIEQKGYSSPYLPSKEPLRGEPTVAVTSPQAGWLDIRGRAHPPGPGVTWARILDGELAPWEEHGVAAGTREIVGWSLDPDELFYVQSSFPVPSGPAFTATIELWFEPTTSVLDLTPTGPPQRLGDFPVKVPKR